MNAAPPDRTESASAGDRLAANLAAQVQTCGELETLILRERERIEARDWSAVIGLAEDKAQRVMRMQSLARELDALTGGRSLRELTRARGLEDGFRQLSELAERVQRANRATRALLDHHQARVGTALRLMNRGDAAGTYGRNGYSGPGRLSQRLAAV